MKGLLAGEPDLAYHEVGHNKGDPSEDSRPLQLRKGDFDQGGVEEEGWGNNSHSGGWDGEPNKDLFFLLFCIGSPYIISTQAEDPTHGV